MTLSGSESLSKVLLGFRHWYLALGKPEEEEKKEEEKEEKEEKRMRRRTDYFFRGSKVREEVDRKK
jgi:hypothetical protein